MALTPPRKMTSSEAPPQPLPRSAVPFPRGIADVWASLPAVLEQQVAIRGDAAKPDRKPIAAAGVTFGGRSYQTVGRTAIIEINGPMTKYRSWFTWFFGGAVTTEIQSAVRAAGNDEDVDQVLLLEGGARRSGNA